MSLKSEGSVLKHTHELPCSNHHPLHAVGTWQLLDGLSDNQIPASAGQQFDCEEYKIRTFMLVQLCPRDNCDYMQPNQLHLFNLLKQLSIYCSLNMFQNIVVDFKNRSHSVQNMCAVQICQWQYTNVKHFLPLYFKQSVSNGNAVFCNVNSNQQN